MNSSEDAKEEILCKICHSACSEEFPYAHPCKCKGSLKYIHIECLDEWLSLSKNKKCDICGYNFKFEKKFRIGAPKNVPFYYVLLFVLKWMLSVVIDAFCLAYAIGKFSFIIFLNSNVGSKYFIKSKSAMSVFLCGLCFTFVNLFHSHFFKKAFGVIGSLRGRIEAGRALQNALGGAASRSENHTPTQAAVIASTSGPSQVSESSESDSQLYENLNGDIEINLSKILFSRPTPQNLKSDMILTVSLSFVSVIYPLIYNCSRMLHLILQKISSHKIFQDASISSLNLANAPSPVRFISLLFKRAFEVPNFVEKTSLTRFYLESTTLLGLLLAISSVLYLLKTRTSYYGFKVGFGLIKSYSLLVCTTVYILVSVGCVSHMFLSNAFNKGEPVFPLSEFKLSFLVHFCFGVAFTYLSKSIKNRLMKRFRRGLIIKTLRDEKVKTLISFCIETSFRVFLRRCIFNFLLSCFFPAITFSINRINLGFSLKFDNELGIYLYFKAFMVLYRSSSSIPQFFANSFEIISKFYSRMFNADNYIYNKEVGDFDRSCLVWALNSRYANQRYLDSLKNINKTIPKTADAKEHGELPGVRRAMRSFISHDSAHTNDSSIADSENSTFSNLSRNTARFLPNLEADEKSNILDKYQITDRRIGKYLGKTHNRKISIFYRPKYFNIFKTLTYLSCFAFVQAIFCVTFRASAFVCSRLQSEESKSTCFVFCCSLIFSLICSFYDVRQYTFTSLLTAIVNRGIVLTYTNLIFPFIGSIGFVFLYASLNVFTYFTSIFVIFNSLSSVNSIIFENVFLASSIQVYSAVYVVRQLCSFLCLKLTVYSSFMIYKRIVKFNSLCIPVVFMLTATFQIVKLTRFMFSGDLMAKIKDYFFLEKTNVIDYDHGDNE